jgi:hypothetical protein
LVYFLIPVSGSKVLNKYIYIYIYIYLTTRSVRLKFCHVYLRPITYVFSFLASLFIFFSVFSLYFYFLPFLFRSSNLICLRDILLLFSSSSSLLYLSPEFFLSFFVLSVFSFSISTLNCHPEIHAQRSRLLSTLKFFSLNFCVCLIIFNVCASYTVPFILYL